MPRTDGTSALMPVPRGLAEHEARRAWDETRDAPGPLKRIVVSPSHTLANACNCRWLLDEFNERFRTHHRGQPDRAARGVPDRASSQSRRSCRAQP